jgi:hypothetical protein
VNKEFLVLPATLELPERLVLSVPLDHRASWEMRASRAFLERREIKVRPVRLERRARSDQQAHQAFREKKASKVS